MRRWQTVAVLSFLLGAVVTVAEPDLQVLAKQVPAIPDSVLIFVVAAGVGLFLALAMLRTRFHWLLARLLLVLYPAVFLLALFAPARFYRSGV